MNEYLLELQQMASMNYSFEIEKATKEFQVGCVLAYSLLIALIVCGLVCLIQSYFYKKRDNNIWIILLCSGIMCLILAFFYIPHPLENSRVELYEGLIKVSQEELAEYESTLDERLILIEKINENLDIFELRESFCRILETNNPEDVQFLYRTDLNILQDCNLAIQAYLRS